MLYLSQRFRCTLLVLFIIVAFFGLAATNVMLAEDRPRNEKAIADVEAGRVETARASWWGFNPSDATKALQSALNCRAKRVVVECMDRPWIVTTIQLPSDKEIVFEPGVVVEAKRGAFLGKSDCLFLARECKRLALLGEGSTFRMHKSDYHKPPYQLAEWRHALSLRGCEDVTIEGLTLAESGGDGIYLGVGSNNATNRNITIRNVICDGNNRQGISVITAENLLIENCMFMNTRGTAPQAGIDFEPNHFEERLVNCVLRNCRSENNAGHAYHLYLGFMHQKSTPISIRFENCTSKGCEQYSTYVGVANRNGERTVRGSIEYVGCRFDADQGAGVYIRGNEADGCKIRFERCAIIRRDKPESKVAPITIVAPRDLDLDAGNVAIVNCMIRDSLDRQPIALIASPMAGLRNVSGSLTVESPDGKTAYTLNAEQLEKWFPTQGMIARIPRQAFDWRKSAPVTSDAFSVKNSTTFRLRREAALIVWSRVGQPVGLTVKMEPVGHHVPKAITINLTSPNGETRELKPKTDEKNVVYTFTPRETGPHRLDWQGDNKETLQPIRCTEPMAILGESSGARLIRPMGTLYFAVPPNVARFAIVVTGDGTAEMVKATIRDAAGHIAAEQDNIAAPHLFILEADNGEITQIWSITFQKASEGVLEDVSVQTVGIPPVFSLIP
ncbi:MAG: right-handed parallel beta-helix repeat-containing protein [Pirellulales bacterium]|nr:right-handed parallel beta-helix repeat-containing protein [Pirellulales bacterium]